MNGPTFLLLYAGLILAAILGTRWFNRWRDARSGEDLPSVPSPADPFELAWLRGGAPEAIRLAVYDLKQQGLLVTQSLGAGGHGVVASGPLDGPGMSIAPIDRLVLRACASPQRAVELMRGRLVQQVDEACVHWRARHEEAGLLIDSARKVQGWTLVLVVTAAFVLLSIARIEHALANGFPFLFLIVLTAIAVVLIPAFGHPPSRLTARGGRYLARLRQALAPDPVPSRRQPPVEPTAAGPQSAMANTANSGPVWSAAASMALLPVALHGTSAMPPVEQAEMQQLFPQATSTSSGGGCGSSSSCGSASSSNGGGDGGGGGCGGGGD